MPPEASPDNKDRLFPWRISLLYLLLGSAWIVVSGIVALVFTDQAWLPTVEIVKGIAFVGVTTVLLWLLCRSWGNRVNQAWLRYNTSQDRYKKYVECSPVSILTFDRLGQMIDANAAAAELSGYTKEALLSTNVLTFNPAHSKEETDQFIEDAFTSSKYTADHWYRKKDGSLGIARVNAVPLDTNELLCFSQDISEQKAAEAELIMSNGMLRVVRRINQTIIHEKDSGALIQKICNILIEDRNFSHAWIALYDSDGQLSHSAEAPEPSGLFAPCRFRPGLSEILVSLAPADEFPELPFNWQPSEALVCAPLAYGNITGYIGVKATRDAATNREEIALFAEVTADLQYALHMIDVEAEKTRVLSELVVAKHEAEQANRAKNDFLAVMSHEMRTPLNPIICHSQLLREELDDPQQQEALDQMRQAGERLLRIIDDILFFVRIENGDTPRRREAFNTRDLCHELLSHLHPAAAIEIRFEETAPEQTNDTLFDVSADRNLLIRLLRELLDNACKYTKEGSVTLRLKVESPKSPRPVHIFEVEDTGEGVSPHLLEVLFTPFTQEDSTYTRKYGGMGLGLAICKKIADQTGGTLTAESRKDRGSKFTFRCPLNRANLNTLPEFSYERK